MAARTSTRVTGIKVHPEDLSDLKDMAAVASFSGFAGRCPGGRIIAKGYICIHCGGDPSDDDFTCPEPIDQRVAALKGAAIGRRKS